MKKSRPRSEAPAPAEEPDFVGLFGPTTEAGESLTPRQAAILHAILGVAADQLADDLEDYGGEPATTEDVLGWGVLQRLPISTWRRDLAWRRRYLSCIEDLIADIVTGRPPRPRCVGEEVALRLATIEAEEIEDEEADAWRIRALPAFPDDEDWALVVDTLLQDLDVDEVLFPEHDGIWEDPAAIALYGPADYRPDAWFDWFLNVEPRR